MNGILGSAVLDVAVGLIFVYLLLALLCTTLNEWLLSYVLNLRSKTLASTLQNLLSGQPLPGTTFADAFFSHPMIAKIAESSGRGAAYLPSRTFATAVIDLISPPGPGTPTFDQIKGGINALPDGRVKTALSALTMHCKEDVDAFRNEIEVWFDAAMDGASGIIKRHAQGWAVVLAIVITLVTNADTIALTRTLWLSSAVRTEIVKAAEARTSGSTPASNAEVGLLGQLIGWEKPPTEYPVQDLVHRVPGWLLTVIAVSLGAPFWFDVLSRFMSVRASGKTPRKTSDPAPAI